MALLILCELENWEVCLININIIQNLQSVLKSAYTEYRENLSIKDSVCSVGDWTVNEI